MKKALTMLMCMLMVFTLAACSSKNKIDEEAMKTYITATDNLAKVKSAAIDMKFLVDADELNTHAKITMNGSFNAKQKLQMALRMDAAVNGIGMEDLATIYMKDDVVYANIMDMQKEYMPLDDKMLSKLNLDKETGNLKTNAEKAFEEMSIERKDGKKIITAVLNKNSLKSAKSYANKSINDDTFNIGDGIKVTDVSEAAYIMTVNEQDQLERLEMKITAAYVMEDADENKKTAVMDINMSLNINDINQVDTIDFPSFKGYKRANQSKTGAKDLLDEFSDENAA